MVIKVGDLGCSIKFEEGVKEAYVKGGTKSYSTK